jgi:hypothetical protein
MSANVLSVSSKFDVFAPKPVQTSILETTEVEYKPLAPVDQTDLEFSIPSDHDTYIDLDIKLYVRGKLTSSDGKDLDEKDFTAVTNNFLHSLFSQCSITLNGVCVTQSTEFYNYRSYLETLLSYGSDAAQTHLTNAFWYLDTGDMLPHDPTAAAKNIGFNERYNKIKQSKEVELYGRIHSDICNAAQYLVPGVSLQIRFTKAHQNFFLMNKDPDSKTVFKFLDAKLFVNRVKPSPVQLIAHNTALNQGLAAHYNITKVELKSFTFASGTQSLSIDNAVLGPLPKRILITMVKNKDFLGSVESNPYNFRHYKLSNFAMYVNGKQLPSEGLSTNFGHAKTAVMGYRTIFKGSGIHHSDASNQITLDMFVNGYFMLLFDLTPDQAASEGHMSHASNGHIRLDLKFAEALPEALNILLYLEYESSVRVNPDRTVAIDY